MSEKILSTKPFIRLLNCDCMELMTKTPDKFYELAICDPPYGIKADKMKMGTGKQNWVKGIEWDNNVPSDKYFAELLRISEKAIIWGGNMFNLPKTMGWIFWDKELNKDISFGDGELAWTNFLTVLKKAPIQYSGFLGADKGNRIHPTQKPVKLYEWLLMNYAKPGDKIFDSHAGSFSSGIACYKLGFDITATELDKDYYEASITRFRQVTSQQTITF